MREKKKINLKILIPIIISIIVITVVIAIIMIIKNKNNKDINIYYPKASLSNLKTFTEITGIKENSIEEEAITITYIYQYQEKENYEDSYEKYLLNDYGFKINQDKSYENKRMFEYNNTTITTYKESKAGFTTYKITIPFEEKIANDNIKNNYDNAIELFNNKEYVQARNIFGLDGVRDYKDSMSYIHYCNGMNEYSDKNYGDAIYDFSRCENFLNANELKVELMEIVGKYNGTYYYKHPKVESLSYYMFVKDGKVDFASVTDYNINKQHLYSYLYSYSICEDTLHIWHEAVGLAITYGFFNEHKKEDYQYSFTEVPNPNGTLTILVAGDSDTSSLYYGFYEKIADTVPAKKELY